MIWLQIPTVFWLGDGNISQPLNIPGINDVRQNYTAEPLVHELSAFEVELANEKLKSHTSPGIDQILAELIKAGGTTIKSEIHKVIISIWNKEKLLEGWKEVISHCTCL